MRGRHRHRRIGRTLLRADESVLAGQALQVPPAGSFTRRKVELPRSETSRGTRGPSGSSIAVMHAPPEWMAHQSPRSRTTQRTPYGPSWTRCLRPLWAPVRAANAQAAGQNALWSGSGTRCLRQSPRLSYSRSLDTAAPPPSTLPSRSRPSACPSTRDIPLQQPSPWERVAGAWGRQPAAPPSAICSAWLRWAAAGPAADAARTIVQHVAVLRPDGLRA
jgi:hypothetical protein